MPEQVYPEGLQSWRRAMLEQGRNVRKKQQLKHYKLTAALISHAPVHVFSFVFVSQHSTVISNELN